ncbi:MAG: right-handed parallel beta-helix repeat-containing protein, partial [Vicinamibacterales bacterium]
MACDRKVRSAGRLLQYNKIHHNAGYGLHFWAAPRGTATRHYIAEGNEVFGNGGGVVVGGTPNEASPPGDGLPHYVEVRYNVVHHNIIVGLNYLGFGCHPASNDNLFHHNTVYLNGQTQLNIIGASGTSVQVKNNIIYGRPYPDYRILVFLGNSNLASEALDGNIYFMEGAGPATTPGPFWFRCTGTPQVDSYYSFDQMRSTGIVQDNSCNPASTCGSSTAIMDSRSRWIDPLVVDPTTSLWTSPIGATRGDFHLRRGSPAAGGGVCCDVANSGLDIDGDAVPSCAPVTCDASVSGVSVGADYPLDDNADGIANRFECSPPDGTLC